MPKVKKAEAQILTKPVEKPVSVPLWKRDDLVFEKRCPGCGIYNHTSKVVNKGQINCRIEFTCSKCKVEYSNWWYGTGPSMGNEPIWRDLLCKPFQAMCMHSGDGLTSEKIYEAVNSTEDKDIIVILRDDNGMQNTVHPREYFITNTEKGGK